MFWLISGIIVFILIKCFGLDRAANIVLGFAILLPITSLILFFYFFELPSQFWKNL